MNLKTLATFAWQQLLLPKVKVVSVLTGSGILYALALQHIDHIVLRAWLAASPKLYEALCHRIALGMAIASTSKTTSTRSPASRPSWMRQ